MFWALTAGALITPLAACGAAKSDGLLDRAPVTTSHAAVDVRDVHAYRLLADEDGVGETTAVIVFDDAAEFDAWWNELGFPGSTPSFDPANEVIAGFTAVYPSGCQYGFRDLRVDESKRTIEARYYGSEPAEACGADENPFTVVAVLNRSALSTGSWEATMSVANLTTSFEVS